MSRRLLRHAWWALPVLATLVLAASVVAGPWLTLRAIDRAIAERDVPALARHVDLPTLRVNLKAHVDDYLVRQAGLDAQASPLGALALRAAGGASALAIDTMVTPAGIAALLQGRMLWKRASGDILGGDTWSDTTPDRPLRDATGRFASTRRFIASAPGADGQPMVLVLSRQGLRWRLTDIHRPQQE